MLTAIVPLGLVACSSGPAAEDAAEAKPPATETKSETSEPEVADPKPVDVEPADPDPRGQKPVDPEPVTPEPANSDGGDNSKPEGMDTPIVKEPRPAKKYGAPPRPRPKYGGPPKPWPKPKPKN